MFDLLLASTVGVLASTVAARAALCLGTQDLRVFKQYYLCNGILVLPKARLTSELCVSV
jgi:hypothetical protein